MRKTIQPEDFKRGVIYMYTSPKGKVYIGQTINEQSRKTDHRRRTVNSNTHFGAALRKYGYENFKYEVLYRTKLYWDIEKIIKILNKLEPAYVVLYNSIKEGYNLASGGDNFIHHESSIEKIRKNVEERGTEWNEKLSASALERIERERNDPELWEKRMNNLKKGQTSSKPLSEETKKKISEANNHKKKRVFKLSMDEEILDSFESIADAARNIDEKYTATIKTKSNRISECLKGKRVSIYEHKWIYM